MGGHFPGNHPPGTRETHSRNTGLMVTDGVTRHTDVSKDGTPASCPFPSKQYSLKLHLCVPDELGAVCVLNCPSEEPRDQVAVVSFFSSPTATALSLKVPSRLQRYGLRGRRHVERQRGEHVYVSQVSLICNLAEVSSGRSRAGTVQLRQ